MQAPQGVPAGEPSAAEASVIGELSEEVSRSIRKIEDSLDTWAASMTATSNVLITLATALAGGLAVLIKDTLPTRPGPFVLTLVLAALLFTGFALALGVLALAQRSTASRRAVEMWDAGKQAQLSILMLGGGDEQRTREVLEASNEKVQRALSAAAGSLKSSLVSIDKLMKAQMSVFLAGALLALTAAAVGYGTQPESAQKVKATVTIEQPDPSSALRTGAPSSTAIPAAAPGR